MGIEVELDAPFVGSYKFLRRLLNPDANVMAILNRYGQAGVEALRNATPIDTSRAANSWTYSVQKTRKGYAIHWRNTHINDGVPIAIILQYGHATQDGGYVRGRDYINPATRAIFDSLANAAWKEVTRVG